MTFSIERQGKRMKTMVTILTMLLTMPILYGMLDQVTRKVRLRIK
jgi:hypothetical protein